MTRNYKPLLLKRWQQFWKSFATTGKRYRKKLEKLRERIIKTSQEPTYGLHRKKQMPLFRVFKREIYGDKDLDEDEISLLVSLTQQVFLIVERELKLIGFWENLSARNKLRADIKQNILFSNNF